MSEFGRHLGDAARGALAEHLNGAAVDGALDATDALRFSTMRFRLFASSWLSPEGVNERVKAGVKNVRAGWSVCESPIERVILPWLVFSDWQPLVAPPVPVHVLGADQPFPEQSLVIVPQMKFANSRFDFMLYVRDVGVRRMIAIECDGRDFHDARDDMARDSYFASWGVPTVRLSGSSIALNPVQAVERVIRAVHEITNQTAAG